MAGHRPIFVFFLALCLAAPLFAQTAALKYPKDLAQPVLNARIRVEASSGLRLPGNFPTPLTPAGGQDATSLLQEDFGGIEFAAGTHRLVISLPYPQVIERVSLLNQSAEGTFTVALSNSDPNLLGPPQAPRLENPLQGPHHLNAAVFSPQAATFIQIELHITKPGMLARFAVYGRASDLDYGLVTPDAPPSPATPVKLLNVGALSAGSRIARVSSSGAGADPAMAISDALGTAYAFQADDRAPEIDVELHATRRVEKGVLYFSGPPSRVDLIKIEPVHPPEAPAGEIKLLRASGNVSTLNLDGSDEKAAKIGTSLQAGQVLQLGWDSMAEVDIDGQSLVRLGPNSSLAVRSTTSGLTLSLLRGSALWQVYKPGAGPLQFVTPSASATLSSRDPSIVVATVQLSGESNVEVLACGLDGVPVRSLNTGEAVSLRAGQRANLGTGTLSPIRLDSFSVYEDWIGSPWGMVLGGLHGDADKSFKASGMTGFTAGLVGGAVLSSVTTAGGLTEVTLPFKEQPLDAVAFRVTPLSDAADPVVFVKAGLFGLYDLTACTVTYKGQTLATSAPPVAAAAPLAGSHPGLASASAVPPPPLPPKAIPVAQPAAIPKATPVRVIPTAPAVGIAVPDTTPALPASSPNADNADSGEETILYQGNGKAPARH